MHRPTEESLGCALGEREERDPEVASHERALDFAARVPALYEPADADDADSSGGSCRAATRPLRVLVVDDNYDAAMTLATLLTMHGHHVQTAHDGVQALEVLERFKPDVAILDIGMPRMNGYALALKIRESLGESRPLLIAVTGWGQREDRIRSKAAGFDHHLVKPLSPDTLESLPRLLRAGA